MPHSEGGPFFLFLAGFGFIVGPLYVGQPSMSPIHRKVWHMLVASCPIERLDLRICKGPILDANMLLQHAHMGNDVLEIDHNHIYRLAYQVYISD